jgi:hypothetical protein
MSACKSSLIFGFLMISFQRASALVFSSARRRSTAWREMRSAARVNLVGGDRLIVDENGDGLLGRCRLDLLVGLGRRPLRGGLAGRRLRGEWIGRDRHHDRTRSQDDCRGEREAADGRLIHDA